MANFLESMLPTIAGAGLAMIPGVGPFMAAGLVGGAQYARTGDINRGLMAGLGAYGGAGLTSGLATAGADKAAQTAATKAIPAPEAITQQSFAPVTQAGPLNTVPGAFSPAPAAPGSVASMAKVAPPVTQMDKVSAGLGQVTQSPGAFGDFLAANKYPAMATAGALAGGMGAFDAPKPPKEEEYIRPYSYDSGFTGGMGGPSGGQSAYTGERMWFQPTYTAQKPYRVAGGGLVALAEGGAAKKTSTDTRTPIRQEAPPAIQVPSYFAPQMTGQSREALAYLMGKLPAMPVSPAPAIQAPVTSSTSMPHKGTWSYDPSTGQFTKSEPPPRGGGGFLNRYTRRSYAEGGSAGLESGGFVVPADVVSALGNGSSSAGLEVLAKKLGAKPIHGPGDGMSDSIPTSIEGRQRAAIAREEAYVPRAQVKRAGGADKLYDMMENVRKKAHGKTSQQRKLSKPDKLVP